MNAPALRLHLVTLGVDDVERSAKFYEALGLKRRARGADGVAFFDAGGVALSLYGRAAVAADAGIESEPRGFGSIALAFNVPSEADVDATLAAAAAAGGTIVKPGHRIFWGGYIGFFRDPDAHLWEVAHNPQFPFDERGQIALPD